ncbi:taste receptor type 1 member 3 [Electrophorus electricus]|uniref:taste receptor type 1 member 3 n=1 Tax=Electrophorus electricus TaxID=8005 RepID=UPI0015CFBDB7|nr:taste receptor type 1 member 3 [Electrophorus electricus]
MTGQWMLLALCCLLRSGHGENPAWFQNITTSLFKSQGDLLLGGLFPINELTSNLSEQLEPGDIHCNRINQYGLALALVMKFTVDEINAIPELLPEITVGFENYDCCNQPGVVIQPTLRFLSAAASEDVEVKCNYTEYATRVMAVIGPCSSELATITGKLLGFFLMPQVSYGATSEDLSDKIQYPSFMRTTPSDHWQAKAVVQLLQEFSWNWVAVVGSDDGYGKQGKQQLSSMAADGNICVAYEGLIPVYDNPVPVILDILDHIVEANVGVVVVFATYQVTTAFFREVIMRNLTAVWVATTSWALYSDLNQLPGMGSVGTVLAFSDITQPLSLLSPYVRELFSRMQEERLQQSQRQTDPNISPLDNPCLGCWDLSPENASIVDTVLVQRTAFSVYAAIYTLAYALHHTLGCNETRCSRHPKRDKIYPWQLLEKLQNISLNLNGTKLDFDQMGNPDIGYDILVWVFGNHTITFQNIGNFNQIITINKDLIKWHTANFTVPTSTCSSECQTGQVHIVKGFHSCCFDCIDCQEGTFQNNTDDIQCTVCPDGQWSTLRSTYCVLPTFTYLSWISYEAIGLVLAGVLILCCQAWVGVLFFRHRSTPLVRAAGGKLAGLCLASLMGGCASVVLFLGEPGNVVCSLQQPLNAFFPTVALSAILAVSLQIVCVIEFPERAPAHLENLRTSGSWMVVLACCGIQAGLTGWFVQQGPSLTDYVASLQVNFVTRFLRCPVEPVLNFGLMMAFNGLLALVSFMCTFMAVKPARQYNLSRDVTISGLAYCVTWVLFIPIYAGLSDKNKSIGQVTVTFLSNMALMGSYYLPKCHLLVKHPELNTDDYFRTYLEGAPPIAPEGD